MRSRNRTKLIGFIGFDGVTALDLIGPLEAFATAKGGSEERYQCQIYGLSRRPFTAESGVTFTPHASLGDINKLDTLIVPGGAGLRQAGTNRRVVDWIRSNAGQIRRIASVCTGIYGLAPTGLLDGRRVTTHWHFAQDVQERFPALSVQADQIFIEDGKYFTAAGVTAGIDLALGMIEADYGRRLALSVARELVVYLKRSGGQAQYSGPLELQTTAPEQLAALTTWITAHLDQPLTVEMLARRAHLSVRQLHRRFLSAFGMTPTEMVERLRMDIARERLSEAQYSIERIAQATGYKSADVFRRAFMRRFGLSPSDYRGRFVASAEQVAYAR